MTTTIRNFLIPLFALLLAWGEAHADDTWQLRGEAPAGAVNNFASSVSVLAIATDGTLYTRGTCRSQVGFNKVYSEGVFKSVDKGATWTEATCVISRLGSSDYLNTLVIAADGAIYAGTLDSGVFKSIDSGATWTAAASSQGLGWPGCSSCSAAAVWSFAVAPDGTLYAGTNLGVYKSVDKDATWAAMAWPSGRDLESNIHSLTVAADGAIYACPSGGFSGGNGIFKSIDKGATWTAASNGLTNGSVKLAAAPDGTIYAGGDDGVFKSVDKGANWSLTSTNGAVYMLVVTPDGTVYAQTAGGFFKSVDKGATWSMSSKGLAFDSLGAASDGTIYGISGGNVYRLAAPTSQAISISSQIINPDTSHLTLKLLVQPSAADVGKTGNFYLAAIYKGQYFFYSNGTKTWKVWNAGETMAIWFTTTIQSFETQTALSDFNISGLPGIQFWLGYGLNESDMISNGKVSMVYPK